MLSLPADIQQRVQAQMAIGGFTSEEEVLREALESLERRQNGLKQLREMVAVAEADVAAGRVRKIDREVIKRDVLKRLADEGIIE
jgi:Arc/MetJ-type ribon-helix-helix transcriptional regulator